MKKIIPNALTAFNLVLGMFAIFSMLQQNFTIAALLIFSALIVDGLDGRVARYYGASSEFGKELDSLCDLVSFGVAPALLAYLFALHEFGILGGLVAAAFATCGALRLARFNVNTDIVKGYFMGLPIPTAGCVVSTFVMLGIKPSGWLFLLFVACFAYLMVSTIRYPDFKGKGGEPVRIIPAAIALAVASYILYMAPQGVLFAVFFGYSLFGVLTTIFGMFSHSPA